MIKRLTWFLSGAVAGAAGAGVAKRKVIAATAELTPAKVARGAARRVGDAVSEGRRAMRGREAELRGRLDGTAPTTLADELALDPEDTLVVDGQVIQPAEVLVVRQARGPSSRRRRRRRS